MPSACRRRWCPKFDYQHLHWYPELIAVNIQADHEIVHEDGFKAPYTLAVIELKEGVRMTSNVIGIEPSKVRCGMPVEVVFDRLSDEVTLPRFRPAQLAS